MRILHCLSCAPGRRRKCATPDALTLRDLPDGAFARIVSIRSPKNAGGLGACCTERLEALGLRVGKIVGKISGMPFHGPVTLVLDGRQIAVGWNISSNVLVVPVRDKEAHDGSGAGRG